MNNYWVVTVCKLLLIPGTVREGIHPWVISSCNRMERFIIFVLCICWSLSISFYCRFPELPSDVNCLFPLAGSTPNANTSDAQEWTSWGNGMEIASLVIFNDVSYFPAFCCPVPLTLMVFLIPEYFPWTSDYHFFCLPFDLVSFYFSVSLRPVSLFFWLLAQSDFWYLCLVVHSSTPSPTLGTHCNLPFPATYQCMPNCC